jgi:hypothetical protein
LYWDINAGNYTKCELVGLGHQHGHDTPLKEATKTEAEVKTKCGVHRQNTLKSSRTHSDLATIEPQEKQTALHQEGRRHAGPIATVPLPHHTSPARVKPSNPDLTTCGGLGSPAVGLHALLETPHGGGSQLPPQHSSSRIHLGNHHRRDVWYCPASKSLQRTARPTQKVDLTSKLHHAQGLHFQANTPRKSLASSSNDEPQRRSPAKLSHPPQSAASQVVARCRCRKRHPPTLSPAALTFAKQRQPL